MNDNTAVTSADQDAWVALSQRLREELAKRTPDVGAMKPDEIAQFVDAVKGVYWLHLVAECWDKKVELELARVTAD